MQGLLRRQYIMAAAISLIGAALCAALFVALRNKERDHIALEFHHASENRTAALWKNMRFLFLKLHSVKSFYEGSENVKRREFAEFNAPLLVEQPTVRAFQWIPRVPDAEREKYESDAAKDGYANFHLLDLDAKGEYVRASRRSEYYPVYFVEPRGGNIAALGYDLAADVECWKAMRQARDTEKLAMTPRLEIAEHSGDAAYLRLFFAVYQKDAALNTVELRRKNLKGFVSAVLRVERIVEDAFSTLTPAGIDVRVVDATTPGREKTLYFHESRLRSSGDDSEGKQILEHNTVYGMEASEDMAGRRWTVVCTAAPSFIATRTTWLPWSATAAGLLLTTVLAAYLTGIANRNARLARLAVQLNDSNRRLEKEIEVREVLDHTLQKSETKYKTVFESSSDALMLTTPEGQFVSGNPAAVAMFGCETEREFVSNTPGSLSPEFQPGGERSSEKARRVMDSALKTGSCQFEWRHRRKDGTEFPAIVLLTRMELDGRPMLQANVRDITEQKRAEAALSLTERRLSLFADNVADVIWTMDAVGRFTYISPSVERMQGLRWEEDMVFTIADSMTPASAALCKSELERYLAEAKKGVKLPSKTLEVELLHKDGSIIHAEVIASAMYDDAGKITAFVGVTRNIDERKRAEERQTRLLARLESVGRLRQELLLPAPIEEKYKKITDAAVEMLGLDFCRIWSIQPGDLCDAGCPHATAEDERHRCKHREKCLHLTASSGRYAHLDGAHRRVPFDCYKIGRIASGRDAKFLTNDATKDPRIHNHQWAKDLGLVSFAGYKIRDNRGEPIGVLAAFSKNAVSEEDDALMASLAETTSRVILDQKAAEVLSRENAKLSAMISGMEEGVVFADADGVVVEVNDFLCRFLKRPREAIIGRRIDEIHHGEILERLSALIDQFRKRIDSEPFVLQRPLGRSEVILRMQPIYRGGRYDGVLLNVIDVSELVCARREADAANSAKSRFLANMSHEIRTPMTAILGYAELLADPKIDSDVRNDYANVIRRNGEHLLELINDILDLSKIESGKIAIDMRRVSVVSLLADVASVVRPRAEQHGVSLSVEYLGAMPETILSDGARLRQAVINLAGNAVKFTEKGSVRIAATFLPQWRADQPAVKIEVIDTGIGIQPEKLSRLFQPFEQADNSIAAKYGGTGLGLAISRQIARLLGGDLTVTSEWGKGSVFTLTVPAGNLRDIPMIEHPSEIEQESAVGAGTSNYESLAGIKILLAEDGDDNRRLIQAILRLAGAEVGCAENGREAVEMAEAGDFDLILMDINMPVMDGCEATRLLRASGFSRPILALTANAMPGDIARCKEAGCDQHISKPIDRARLLQSIAARVKIQPADKAIPSTPPPPSPTTALSGEEAIPENAAVSQYADDPEIAPILGEFVGRLQGQVEAMRHACADGRHEELQRFAHRLKGAGGSYGYPALTRECKPLEDAAKACDRAGEEKTLAAVAALADAIVREYNINVPTGSIPS